MCPKLAMPGVRPDSLPGVTRQPASRDLPVRRHRARIVEKVLENRVTLIFADTGSGKSSQVPQMLLDENLGPILCTQPRRLAVVAVAKRVAEERGCALGEDVGYQIGQLNHSTTRTKIVFKTAGILFEELRTNGAGALSRYKVVILDEVHERSVESDLVLTCMKQLIRTTSVKLVLMSATADLLKYEEYFNDIGRGEGVEKIAIQNIAEKLQSVILNTKVVYLDQAVKLLGNKPHHMAVLDAMNENFVPSEKGKSDIGAPTQNLMRDLIVHLHQSEPDLSKNVLVFLPTYRILEQQWLLLKATREPFQLYVLHSSVDMHHSIRAMEACPVKQRKIILATNVAESSITIPGVSFVIDACRHLEIFWDNSTKKDGSRLVWVSESQANQRKGRTGRTCDGTVYRLVPRNHFLKIEKFETPSMQLLSLKKQVLMILCASSKALNDPAALLKKSMNPPATETVQDALATLEEMNASRVDPKGKHQPTLYGQLLVSLPLSLEAAVLVVRGGQHGYPRESAVLAAILDCTPNPILKPFGNTHLYQANVESYYKPDSKELRQGDMSKSTIMLANLHAYEFWQRSFKDNRRAVDLVQKAKRSRVTFSSAQKSNDEVRESDWCFQHRLSITSLRSVEETVDTIIEALHRFRPEFLRKIEGPPSYIVTENSQHTCSSAQATSNGDASHDTVDASNGWSRDEPGNKAVDEHENDGEAGVAPKADDADPWDDWSFQVSEKTMHGNLNSNGVDECESIGQDRSRDEPAGNGQPGYSHPSSANGQAECSNPSSANGQAGCSNTSSGNGKLTGSHRREGDERVNVVEEVKGKIHPIGLAAPPGSNAYEDYEPCPSVPYTRPGTFHSSKAEKLLLALIVQYVTQTQRGTQQPVVPECTLRDLQLSSPTPMCIYFQKGNCNKGEDCLFSHSPYANPVACRFFNSPSGCRYGDGCRYSHTSQTSPPIDVLPFDGVPINFDEPAPTAQSMLDLLPVLNDDEFFLLFGEGDFSFAEGLSNYVDPRKILATSLDKEEIFWADPVLSQRLKRLASLEMQMMWNVDVTSLTRYAAKGKRSVSANSTRSICWSKVRCMLWNFPFADIDENAAEHQKLMTEFFQSLSVIMIFFKVHNIPVILTLCNDQYCRWQVERAARNSFFFLTTSVPFDVSTFGGYCPVRNNLQSSFPMHRPLIYLFQLHPPKTVLEKGLMEGFREAFQ